MLILNCAVLDSYSTPTASAYCIENHGLMNGKAKVDNFRVRFSQNRKMVTKVLDN